MIDATSRAKNAVDDEKMVNARRIQIANAILIGNRAVPFHANAIVTDDAWEELYHCPSMAILRRP